MKNLFASIFIIAMLSIVTNQATMAYGTENHDLVQKSKTYFSREGGNGVIGVNIISFTTIGNGLTKGSHSFAPKENGTTRDSHGKGNSLIPNHKGGGGYR